MIVKQVIYTAGHPSPLNRNRDFIGSRVFEEAQDYLCKIGREFSWDLE